MADRLWRVQVTHLITGSVPADNVVNVWHFDDDDDPVQGPEDTLTQIDELLTAFYDAVGLECFANTHTGVMALKVYDLADPEPRVPVSAHNITGISNSGSPPLPEECALTMSFVSEPMAGQNPASQRGRIYLGPLSQSSVSNASGRVRPTSTVLNAVAAAADDLQDGKLHVGAPGFRLHWSIYSPTWHKGRAATAAGSPAIPPHNLGEAFNDVDSGWIDDALDTQRRRGPAATSRVTFA